MLSDDQIKSWLKEDIGPEDITTTALIPDDIQATAKLVCKEDGVLFGIGFMEQMLNILEAQFDACYFFKNGDFVEAGTIVATFKSSHANLLKAERPFLNLCQHLSGISTITRHYVDLVSHTKARILDTRKTTPGFRLLEKQAVLAGGGLNHRIGLFDQFLIKENHLEAYRKFENPFKEAILKARAYKKAPVTIEVENFHEAELALEGAPDVILLDNMSLEEMSKTVKYTKKLKVDTLLEASGGITEESIIQVAETGVDRISVGCLTHSVKSLDLSLLLES